MFPSTLTRRAAMPVFSALRQHAPRIASRQAFMPPTFTAMRPNLQLTRNIYKKPVPPKPHFNKEQVDQKVLELLKMFKTVEPDKITMEANLDKDLYLDNGDKYGLIVDMEDLFGFDGGDLTEEPKFASGREYAQYIVEMLKREGRLKPSEEHY